MVEATQSNAAGKGAGAGGTGEDGGMTFDDLLTEQTVSEIHRHAYQHVFVGDGS